MADKRKLSDAVKREDPAFMTPKKARRSEEGSPDYSPAVEVEMPDTANARRIARETTKEEEDRSKMRKGIGGKRRTRRKSSKHRRTHKKRKF